MSNVPPSEHAVKIRFSVDDLLDSAWRLERLRDKAGDSDERHNWTRDLQRVRRELRDLAPVRQCASRRPQTPRFMSRAGTGRAPGSPQRGAGGVPPPGGGDDDPDPDADPPPDPDGDAIASLGRIMGTIMPDDRDVAACIVRRIRSVGRDREKGIMQLAFAVWTAGLDNIVVDCRDVCAVLGVDHISASTFPVVSIALGAEYASVTEPIINSRAGGRS